MENSGTHVLYFLTRWFV